MTKKQIEARKQWDKGIYNTRPKSYGLDNIGAIEYSDDLRGCKWVNILSDTGQVDFDKIKFFIRDCGDDPSVVAKIQVFKDDSRLMAFVKGNNVEYMGVGKPYIAKDIHGEYHAFSVKFLNWYKFCF